MCRHNQFWGMALFAFGIGVLIGTWISGAFFCHVLGIVAIIAGYCVGRKNK